MYVATRDIVNLALGISFRKGRPVDLAVLPSALQAALLAEGAVVEQDPAPESGPAEPAPAPEEKPARRKRAGRAAEEPAVS